MITLCTLQRSAHEADSKAQAAIALIGERDDLLRARDRFISHLERRTVKLAAKVQKMEQDKERAETKL